MKTTSISLTTARLTPFDSAPLSYKLGRTSAPPTATKRAVHGMAPRNQGMGGAESQSQRPMFSDLIRLSGLYSSVIVDTDRSEETRRRSFSCLSKQASKYTISSQLFFSTLSNGVEEY